MFLYFLDKNRILFIGGGKLIDDHTLVALTDHDSGIPT